MLRGRLSPLIRTIGSSGRLPATAKPALTQQRLPQLTQPSNLFSSFHPAQRTSDADYTPSVSPALLRAVLAGQRNSPSVATFEDTYILGPPTMSSPPRSVSAASVFSSKPMQHIDAEQSPSPFIDQPIDSIPSPSPASPTSSPSILLPSPLFTRKSLPPLSMMELVHRLTSELAAPHLDLDAVHSLMAAYDSSLNEWQRFAFWDESKRYTRNLIATDYSTFTLMLLCWNAQQGSPVHDHASSECFMRVVQGRVAETQYSYDRVDNITTAVDATPADSITSATCATSPSALSSSSPLSSPLQVRRQHTVGAGSVLFINDSIGLHKIENSFPERAVTLHCYIPPYESCRCYNEHDGAAKESYVHFYSENGERLPEH